MLSFRALRARTMRGRVGFTLVELLVVIAIIGILVALLLPAINMARQAAYKNSCRNKVKLLALAANTYAEARKEFPALFWRSYVVPPAAGQYTNDPYSSQAAAMYSWIVAVLPYMEEKNLYDAMKKGTPTAANANNFGGAVTGTPPTTGPNPQIIATGSQGMQVTVPGSGNVSLYQLELEFLRCPSFAGQTTGISNYVAMAATQHQVITKGSAHNNDPGGNGVITPGTKHRGVSLAGLRDGVSKTILITESKRSDTLEPEGAVSAAVWCWALPGYNYVCAFTPAPQGGTASTATPTTYLPMNPSYIAGSTVPLTNGTSGSPFTATLALNFGPKDASDSTTKYNNTAGTPSGWRRCFGPASDHIGDVIIHGMGDGSVQDVVATVDAAAYFASSSRNGGEPFSITTE